MVEQRTARAREIRTFQGRGDGDDMADGGQRAVIGVVQVEQVVGDDDPAHGVSDEVDGTSRLSLCQLTQLFAQMQSCLLDAAPGVLRPVRELVASDTVAGAVPVEVTTCVGQVRGARRFDPEVSRIQDRLAR